MSEAIFPYSQVPAILIESTGGSEVHEDRNVEISVILDIPAGGTVNDVMIEISSVSLKAGETCSMLVYTEYDNFPCLMAENKIFKYKNPGEGVGAYLHIGTVANTASSSATVAVEIAVQVDADIQDGEVVELDIAISYNDEEKWTEKVSKIYHSTEPSARMVCYDALFA